MCLGAKPFEIHDQYFFQKNTYGYSPYITSSVTRGWVCRLQFMLVLASAVTLGSESRRTRDCILLSQIRDSPNLEGHFPVFISPRIRVAKLYPQALGSLSLPPTTRRAMVEKFEPSWCSQYIASARTTHRKHNTVLLLGVDHIENRASYIVACWNVFT
jgi:hypothetical protein